MWNAGLRLSGSLNSHITLDALLSLFKDLGHCHHPIRNLRPPGQSPRPGLPVTFDRIACCKRAIYTYSAMLEEFWAGSYKRPKKDTTNCTTWLSGKGLCNRERTKGDPRGWRKRELNINGRSSGNSSCHTYNDTAKGMFSCCQTALLIRNMLPVSHRPSGSSGPSWALNIRIYISLIPDHLDLLMSTTFLGAST